jgi:hypothetical protein
MFPEVEAKQPPPHRWEKRRARRHLAAAGRGTQGGIAALLPHPRENLPTGREPEERLSRMEGMDKIANGDAAGN